MDILKIEMLIKKNYDRLNENDLSTLRFILDNKAKCAEESITDMANRCNISKSSILRTTQKLGFSGFSEFKYALKDDLHPEMIKAKNYFEQTQISIKNTLHFFEKADLQPIYKKIKESRHVYAYGTGFAQKNAVSELKRNFLNLGVIINLLEARRELKGAMQWMTEDDLLIVVSLSGDIPDILDDLKLLRIKEIPVLSITDMSFEHNELANIVPYNLYFQSTQYPVKHNNKVGESPIISLVSLNVLCEALSFEYLFQFSDADKDER